MQALPIDKLRSDFDTALDAGHVLEAPSATEIPRGFPCVLP